MRHASLNVHPVTFREIYVLFSTDRKPRGRVVNPAIVCSFLPRGVTFCRGLEVHGAGLHGRHSRVVAVAAQRDGVPN